MIGRQLALFSEEHSALLARIGAAHRAYDAPGAGEAEERFGEYMDLVEEAEDALLALRDRYAATMAARDRSLPARVSQGGRAAAAVAGRPPRLRRAMDPDLDE